MRIRQPARRLERHGFEIVAVGEIGHEGDEVVPDIGMRRVQAVDQPVAHGVLRDELRVRLAEPRIVAADGPGDPRHVGCGLLQLGKRVHMLQHRVRHGPEPPVALGPMAEIDGAVIGEIDLARAPVRPDELAGVVAHRQRERIGAGIAQAAGDEPMPSSARSQA
jgi:hypothetical protein